ncbi:YaaA family protein [Paraconexibacter algicola]|uniref:Peroxide stress protein YaaA n=1 Tax=Paraconexibacter algicola TaxID=2133960 RepID=A0A2T4UGX9_9ACTN|nr:peroxide stress protein YaaA [Paraconexibacter algicola]PTL58503.1 hypothetical protein C7Y72_01945 [Paraconexibacter algicola]
MLVLLPPSEGKTAPADGAPVDVAALVHDAELGPVRARVLDALVRLCAGRSRTRALDLLGLSPGLAGELDRNATLRDAPAGPAADVYSGVLYQHLDLGSLTPRARERAAERVLVASALWGVVRLEDRIPAYRLSIGATMPALRRTLAATWKPALTAALPPEDLVVDCRSGGYAAAWKPAGGTLVAVRAFSQAADGTRKPISHMAKATRGDVARLVAQARTDPRSPEDLATLVERSGRTVELARSGRPGAAGAATWTLDVIETA